jgi:hypothetical protein
MKPLSRRTLLRGAGSAAIALPFLEAMTPRRAQAQTKGGAKRLFTMFTENGVVGAEWFPTGDTKNFTFGQSLQPMEAWKSNMIVFDGLDLVCDGSNGGGGHQRGKTGCLTAQPNDNGRALGISIDQVIANQIGTTTRFKSLEASVWLKGLLRDGVFFSGPKQVIVTEDDPTLLFARLFSAPLPMAAGPTTDPAAAAELARVRAQKQSILDRTLDEYKRVFARVDGGDKQRLQAHMDAIREVERGLTSLDAGGAVSMSCKKPDGMPGNADFVTAGKAQIDLLTLALACDLSRVVSLQWRSSYVPFTWMGVDIAHHDLSHQQGNAGADAKLTKVVQWFAGQAAYLLGRLKSFPDASGGSVLDNTIFYWPNELSTGTHKHNRTPVLMASGNFVLPSGKTLETGRLLKYPTGTFHSGLLTVLANIMGVPITNFGAPQWQKGPLPNVI